MTLEREFRTLYDVSHLDFVQVKLVGAGERKRKRERERTRESFTYFQYLLSIFAAGDIESR